LLTALRGLTGELRRGYHRVATLGAWDVDTDGKLTAAVEEFDDFWADAPFPASVKLRVGRSQWVWPVDLYSADKSVVRGKVQGRPEIR